MSAASAPCLSTAVVTSVSGISTTSTASPVVNIALTFGE